jgi:hypothetical protein
MDRDEFIKSVKKSKTKENTESNIVSVLRKSNPVQNFYQKTTKSVQYSLKNTTPVIDTDNLDKALEPLEQEAKAKTHREKQTIKWGKIGAIFSILTFIATITGIILTMLL